MSEWAARCPRCGASLDDAEPAGETEEEQPPAAGGAEGAGQPYSTRHGLAQVPAGVGSEAATDLHARSEAAHPPWSWRDRAGHRRDYRILAASAALVLIAGVLLGVSFSGSVSPSSGPDLAPPGLRAYAVLYAGSDGVKVVPLNGGPPTRPVTFAAKSPAQTGDGVVFLAGGSAYLLSGPRGAPRLLGPAWALFSMRVPWMVGVTRQVSQGVFSASYIDLPGGNTLQSAQWRLPRGYLPVSESLAVGPAGLRIWQQGPDGMARLGPVIGTIGAPVAVNGYGAAWQPGGGTCAPDGECPLKVARTYDQAGRVKTSPVAPPAGHHGFLDAGALSPDGLRLAVFVAVHGHPGEAQLAMVNMKTLRAALVAGSTVSNTPGRPEALSAGWTPDGHYVLFSGSGSHHMHAYSPGGSKAVTLGVKGSRTFAILGPAQK